MFLFIYYLVHTRRPWTAVFPLLFVVWLPVLYLSNTYTVREDSKTTGSSASRHRSWHARLNSMSEPTRIWRQAEPGRWSAKCAWFRVTNITAICEGKSLQKIANGHSLVSSSTGHDRACKLDPRIRYKSFVIVPHSRPMLFLAVSYLGNQIIPTQYTCTIAPSSDHQISIFCATVARRDFPPLCNGKA